MPKETKKGDRKKNVQRVAQAAMVQQVAAQLSAEGLAPGVIARRQRNFATGGGETVGRPSRGN